MEYSIGKTTMSLMMTCVLMTSFGQTKKNEETSSLDDKTPIVEKDLSELAPDMTLNDAPSVLEVLGSAAEFDMFHKALKSADMAKKLDNMKDMTLFAPINGAFDRITEAKLAHLKTPEGEQEMRHLLNYHLVDDEYDFETLESTIHLNGDILRLKTLNGGYLALTVENGEIFITDETGFQSKIITPDIEAENGVVHALNAVLLAQ